jgi:hypothetical protein
MLSFGSATRLAARFVTLNWQEVELPRDALPQDLPKTSGLYSYQGCHDANGAFGVLYIGQAKNLAQRLRNSLVERLYWEDGTARGQYSDVWHTELRIAPLEASLMDEVEALLIAAHSPPFNNQHVRSLLKRYEKPFASLVVLNGGRKGPLLSTACGLHYLPKAWPIEATRPVAAPRERSARPSLSRPTGTPSRAGD